MLTCGAGLDLVVGVAGSGKTTLLAAVRAGFETAGYQVLGVATSGQAARGLADGAGIVESRTVASLRWRLDHDQVTLTDGHVIILDEAGMTDDADLGAILAAAQHAGAKLIVAGDDRQLGTVGPGGGLAALLTRHPQRVARLDENVRQHDPNERTALAELRAGSVEHAVNWYANHGRIRSGADGDETIGWMVAAWADDIVACRDSLLLAWQRIDVAELNQRARAAYGELGYLSGPEIEAPGGGCYAAGDRIVTLQPGPHGAWVTFERATVTAFHPRDGSIDALTGDGRHLHLDRDATSGDRLAHAYAVTAHRAQGATVDTAHVLDDGGGRELAYVAMSRARMASHVYTTAANPAEAAERVAYSWEAERRPTWATDQGQPTPAETPQPEPDALQQVGAALEERGRYEYDLQQLRQGTGHWADTPAGRAALNLTHAKANYRRAVRHASDQALRRRERRAADGDLAAARQALEAARADWEPTASPTPAGSNPHRRRRPRRPPNPRQTPSPTSSKAVSVDPPQRASPEAPEPGQGPRLGVG